MPEQPDLSAYPVITVTVRCLVQTSRTKFSDLTGLTTMITNALNTAFADQPDVDGAVVAVLLSPGRDDPLH